MGSGSIVDFWLAISSSDIIGFVDIDEFHVEIET